MEVNNFFKTSCSSIWFYCNHWELIENFTEDHKKTEPPKVQEINRWEMI